ncbi:phosphonate C-P lyase system protein PhnG [Rhizobiaceae bacterium BDR2-2]|uniref:Phosphonate C-P lyase system protein PhnG n=1 Tax=Ectorhizobium quercum TaxID=2965071 RepID=A0AAE3MWF8_9HYPH|nr:phosphonate C-P lyase system protein PhnG [Ectorhizobium quercum]MCX8995651.1 phosphonate C-P lyase system protein PhnG [Ectorhizobium quercum]
MAETAIPDPGTARAKRASDLIARATRAELKTLIDALGVTAEATPLRGPETGLVMVRGRMGGGGSPFNLGEVTVSRATMRLASGTVGHAHALGTDREKARLGAIVHALWQEEATRDRVESGLLAPVERRITEENARKRAETAATRVDFFTMVRGED